MSTRTRARTAHTIARGQRELRGWLSAWEAQAQATVDICRQTLTSAPGERPSSRQLVALAAGWVTLPWKHWLDPSSSPELGRRGVTTGATGAAEKVTDWYLNLWGASIDCWASALGCGHAEDLLFEFDEAAEMVGPGEQLLSGGPVAVSAVSDLVHEQGLGKIPSDHVVARVLDGCLVVSVVDLVLLQPALASGAYRGTVTLSSGLVLPVCATKIRH